MTPLLLVHGTAVTFGDKGVLIRGKPGSGKSTLALQLIDGSGFGLGTRSLRAKLVADDQVELHLVSRRQKQHLDMACPAPLCGVLELRGVGLVTAPFRPRSRLVLVVDLQALSGIERLPEEFENKEEILGIVIPRVILPEHHPAAAARLRAVLSARA